MGRKRKSGKRGVKPDEYFASGHIEMAGFGETMVMRSNATPSQFQEMQARMVQMLPEVVERINDLVGLIAERVARLPADRLLHRGWWEFAATAIMSGPSDVEESGALRLIDYVQSVIASVPPAENQETELSDEDWAQLGAEVQELFETITLQYQPCLTAHRRNENPNLDMALEEFRFRAETMWVHVRGKRYQVHEEVALRELLLPHSDVLQRLFGVTANSLVDELAKILRKLSAGAFESMMALKRLQEDSMPRLEAIMSDPEVRSMEDARDKLWADPVFAKRRDEVAGEVVGLDLFDVEKITVLPMTLIDNLAWSAGEESSFFAPGEFAGWPLRIWPTMRRPFIRLEGRILCFDMWSLFDNVYRAIQRILFELEPDYRPKWNARQKTVTEELPFTYFEKLLPGARCYKSVNYRWKQGKGKSQWFECDGLIIFDDHLFVVEVKAGAFTYTSPATDLPAHLKSLENLLKSPASQGSRFVDYLISEPEVVIADDAHEEIDRLRHSDFRQISVLAITLDSFTELTARAQHLKSVGIDLGKQQVLPVSIDDLRIYADLFDNPLVFLHFIEQRLRAASSHLVDLNDEMDHVGLYFAKSNYAQFAEEFHSLNPGKLNLHGFREPIDEYYTAVINGQVPTRPHQEMPEVFAEIIDWLGTSARIGRSQIASFLLDFAGDFRQVIADGIADQLRGNEELRRQRPLMVSGGHPLTICSYSGPVDRDKAWAIQYTRSLVAANREESRLLLELEYDRQQRLVNVSWEHVTLAGLASSDVLNANIEGQRLKAQRLRKAREKGKIPVNSPCPCGSGKKYKRCCRP